MGLLWLKGKRLLTLIGAIAWVGYAGYEYLMYTRVLCSGECNIRVDLLVIWPALIVIALVVTAGYARRAWRARKAAGD